MMSTAADSKDGGKARAARARALRGGGGPRPKMPAVHKPEPDEPPIRWGPAMATLDPRNRRFVMALFELGGGRKNYAAALRMAGYPSQGRSLNNRASQLAHDPRIIDAITEVT